MAEYTTNYNLKKPGPEDFYDVEDFNQNMDVIDEELKKASESGGSGTEIEYVNMTISAASWTGSEFPYTAAVEHGLGSEPEVAPTVDIDLSSYITKEDIEKVEEAWANVYRVSFDATNMTLYSKEIPTVSFTVMVKAVI